MTQAARPAEWRQPASSTGVDRKQELSASSIRMHADNVLVLMDWIRDARKEDRSSSGLLVLPGTKKPERGAAVYATVVAVGPGSYLDKWLDHERGSSVVGSKVFAKPEFAAGDRVLVDHADQGDGVIVDGLEHRIVRIHNILGVVEDGEDPC